MSSTRFKERIKRLQNSRTTKEITSFAGAIGKKYVASSAASIAYYIFISMIPLFILLCSQLPLTGISKDEMTDAVVTMIPESIRSLVASIISEAYDARIGVFSVSIVILLWSSSKGVLALIRALDIVYDVRDSRNFIDMFVFSVFYTVCILLGISVLLVIYTKERSAEEVIRAAMPSKVIVSRLTRHFRDFDVACVGTIAAAFIYKIAPAGRRRLLNQLPGAVFSVIGIMIFSEIFAKYSSGSNVYNSFYGSLTQITILLIWLYSCLNIFLIGGVINSHYKMKIAGFTKRVLRKLRRKLKRKPKNEAAQ